MKALHPARNATTRWQGLCGTLFAVAVATPMLSPGCSSEFDPPSKVSSLRVFAVTTDKPYAAPGDEVKLEISYSDQLDPEAPRDVQVLWLPGCFNPEGDQYYACYGQLAKQFAAGPTLPATGDAFTLKMPADIITARPVPKVGPHYGIAYVFFAVCAGNIQVIPFEESGSAGYFPLGCFDSAGNRLGAESFVPGYTQIYSFADGRKNQNPTPSAFTINGAIPDEKLKVERCALTDEERRATGCSAKTPYTECTSYTLDVAVASDIAEEDVGAKGRDGQRIKEVVWVDYFANKGDIETNAKLVSEAELGITEDHSVRWVPPSEPGIATLWAVVHDTRGGSTVMEQTVSVE